MAISGTYYDTASVRKKEASVCLSLGLSIPYMTFTSYRASIYFTLKATRQRRYQNTNAVVAQHKNATLENFTGHWLLDSSLSNTLNGHVFVELTIRVMVMDAEQVRHHGYVRLAN